MRQILRHGFLILALLYGYCCIAQDTKLTKEEVLKLYQESSLEKHILLLDSFRVSINKFVKDPFDNIYQGDFNDNGTEDLLTAIIPNYGCGYQFFLMDYQTNKKAKQVVKLNPDLHPLPLLLCGRCSSALSPLPALLYQKLLYFVCS